VNVMLPGIEAGPGRYDVLRMNEDRCLLQSLHRGFSACRTHHLPQEQVPPISARAGIPAGQRQAAVPKQPLGDVMDMPHSGNKLRPTQKPIPSLVPLIRSFTL
jgi:hypothetical protein